ncbi:Hypothetical predicted protein [Octopus vulgaris]|uniref:Uncharacterized protein n=1 Tax=Octopus vulgaris TaxID=6645 RepID=A0AA36BYD5_OCTVU|nr:Hypothetical predicted protein [Octopus vulgaris]
MWKTVFYRKPSTHNCIIYTGEKPYLYGLAVESFSHRIHKMTNHKSVLRMKDLELHQMSFSRRRSTRN